MLAIDGSDVHSVSELQEHVARNRPGKEINVKYLRDGQVKEITVRLKNSDGNLELAKREIKYELNGIEVEDVQFKELAELTSFLLPRKMLPVLPQKLVHDLSYN